MNDSPNILWLMTDEQRADSLSCSGTPWAHTPNLDQLTLAGTRFNAAYTPSPVCVSARACLLTGQYGSSIGVLSNHHKLSQDEPHFLTKIFSENNYQVASFGKHHYNCDQPAFDLEVNHVLGDRVHYFDYQIPVNKEKAGIVRYDGGKSPWLFAGRFPGDVKDTPEMQNVETELDWMKARDPSRPYFMRLSFNAPHTPVVTPAPFDTLIERENIHIPIEWSDNMAFVSNTHRDYLCDYAGTHRLTEDQIYRARQCYYGYVACVDFVFGKFLEALEKMGAMKNTIIVFVSDHGTHLGDHGFFQKQSYWDGSSRVPYFFSGPGIQKGLVDTPVNTGSLLPTLLELAGLSVPEGVQFPSLATNLVAGTVPDRVPVFSEIDYGIWNYRTGDRYVMVRDGRYKMMLYRNPRDPKRFTGNDDCVLFDLETDPGEMCNVSGDPVYGSVMERLINKLDVWDSSRVIVEPKTLTKRAL